MKRNKKFKSYFELKELIAIVCAFVVITSSLTGYLVYLHMTGKDSSSAYLGDIITSYNKIKNDYYEDLDEEKLSSAAISGMMDYLGEWYTEYLDNSGTDSLNDKLNGSYKGIGIRIISQSGVMSVYEVFDKSPASKAGLKEGDIFVEVNGKSVADMSVNEVAEIIQDEDKQVKIKVRRDKEELDLTVSVETLDTPVVDSKIVDEDDKIGYLQLTNFSDTSYKQFSTSLKKLESDGISSLIIDLRENTGGYLKEAENIASMFLKKGKTIYYLDEKKKKERIADKTKEERNIPVVIIINHTTASASEVLAASLRDSYGAIIVGNKSFGKGKVQQTSKLSDNQSIKYTTAKWYTPDGECIDGVGITPGIEVSLSEEYAKNPGDETDDQLKKAIEILRNDD